jgi:hypothetical protein
MKHLGSDIVALQAPLGKAAKLTVEEGPHRTALRRVPNRPKNACSGAVHCAVRSGRSPYRTTIPSPAGRLHATTAAGLINEKRLQGPTARRYGL